MSLTLHLHPLASFCQKVLVGLYELEVPFEKHVVDLMDEAQRTALEKLWPIGKFPVLRDDANHQTVAESSIILEYVDRLHGPALIPADPALALECRFWDRFHDLYVNTPVAKIVTDKLRPAGQNDVLGVEQAKSQLRKAYDVADDRLRGRTWAVGDVFTMADCSAAPALFYAEKVLPFGDAHGRLAAYFRRISERPSFVRVLEEAKPYLHMFPG